MKLFLALVRKDFLLELRTKETLTVLLTLSLLLSVIASYGINSAILSAENTRRLFPVLVWIVFIFSATVSINRSFEHELEGGALDGLVVSGAPPYIIYLAKVLSNALVMCAAQLISVTALSVLLNIALTSLLMPLCILSILVITGYSALATLLAGIAGFARLKGMLLPVLLLPVLFPILFAALELTDELIMSGELLWESAWLSLLIGLDVVYVVLGVNLFEYVIKE